MLNCVWAAWWRHTTVMMAPLPSSSYRGLLMRSRWTRHRPKSGNKCNIKNYNKSYRVGNHTTYILSKSRQFILLPRTARQHPNSELCRDYKVAKLYEYHTIPMNRENIYFTNTLCAVYVRITRFANARLFVFFVETRHNLRGKWQRAIKALLQIYLRCEKQNALLYRSLIIITE